jgi:hypothetical protein
MRSDDDAMMALVPTTWLDKNPQYFFFSYFGGVRWGVGWVDLDSLVTLSY